MKPADDMSLHIKQMNEIEWNHKLLNFHINTGLTFTQITSLSMPVGYIYPKSALFWPSVKFLISDNIIEWRKQE